jgi:hypothetical protein
MSVDRHLEISAPSIFQYVLFGILIGVSVFLQLSLSSAIQEVEPGGKERWLNL